jgi:acetylglutamate kinase
MKTNTQNTVNTTLITKISETKGRFFGLYLRSGEVLNAQYRSQTDSYVRVFDRNAKQDRLIKKTSITAASV